MGGIEQPPVTVLARLTPELQTAANRAPRISLALNWLPPATLARGLIACGGIDQRQRRTRTEIDSSPCSSGTQCTGEPV